MTMTMKNFMGDTIDTSDYYAIFKDGCKELEQFNNATFVKFAWEYIGDLEPDDPQLDNEGIKADMNTGGGASSPIVINNPIISAEFVETELPELIADAVRKGVSFGVE